MSESIADNPTTEEPQAEQPVPEPQGDSTDWKAEARKWESRAKADHELANKWREYESSQKTEFEKLAEDLAKAQAEASQASAELMRLRIAAEKGISGDATKLLKGTTQEELEAEAELLLSLIANQSKPKSPQPDENQGKPAPTKVGQLTREDLKGMTQKEIMEAKAAGRLDDLLGKN